MSKAKSALIINPYWDSFGGGERYTASFILFLLNSGWKVDILWPQNISYIIKQKFGLDITNANYVDNKVYTSRYDIAFYVSDGSLPTSFAKKTIIHFQFPFKSVNGKSLANRIKSPFYTYVCNSHFTQKFIYQEYGVKSHVVYPPITTADFKPLKKLHQIIYVGRFSQLTQKKNQHLLVSTFKQLHSSLPDWQLVLAGGVGVGADEKYMADLQEASKSFPIKIIANPDLSELQKLYGQSAIFWSAVGLGVDEHQNPRQVEHFGMSLVEAMSAGCVPVVLNLGGYTEIITPQKDGLLVNTMAELRQQTLNLIDSGDKLNEYSKSAIEKSRTFDIANFYRSWAKII